MNYAEWIYAWNPEQDLPSDLENQIRAFDLEQIKNLVQQKQELVDWNKLAEKAQPPAAFRVNGNNRFSKDEAISTGAEMLSAGKVATILVAGGQGTRLGFDQPKGLFPIGPVSNRTLFEMFLDQLKALGNQYGAPIPLYVMTSPATHDETVSYFAENDSFGLSDDQLRVFCQGTMPAVDRESGKILMASPTEFALSPNGHGGMLDALNQSGCLESAINQGIENFFYAQIDNPLVQVCDPELLGYHALSESEMSTQVVTKAHPLEKVGNVVEVDGQVQIIEYSDLPERHATRTGSDGEPLFWAGNIAVHVFSTSFLDRASQQESSLPFHLALKKVSYVDEHGNVHQPEKPNAIKFEKFIFDLLPLAKNAIVVEVDKAEGFAPVKNADGAPADTPELARQAISDLHKRWLRSCGVTVSHQSIVEIHPAFALNAKQLANKTLPDSIDQNKFFAPN